MSTPSVPRGTIHTGGPLVMEKDDQAEDNERIPSPVFRIDREAFALAVQACLKAAVSAKSPGGLFIAPRPPTNNIAVEIREALRRAYEIDFEVQDWEDDLLAKRARVFGGMR